MRVGGRRAVDYGEGVGWRVHVRSVADAEPHGEGECLKYSGGSPSAHARTCKMKCLEAVPRHPRPSGGLGGDSGYVDEELTERCLR